ncbi:MAG: hypothetical protein M1829_001401 [Trizodia sp. TS-e1964]|nr:MAG: hypothetical protein M1829_001401 [Trizodia sp. TS-e1964]
MFCDLNIPWAPNDGPELQQTLSFLDELGYNVLALTHTLSGKLPADLRCPIPIIQPFITPAKLRLLRRCNLVLETLDQNNRLAALSQAYDLLAIRPTTEKALQQACLALECDLISIDLSIRHAFFFKPKLLLNAVKRGVRIEICYASGLASSDGMARKNLISNATNIIRATKGNGIIFSSEAKRALGIRGPADVINLGVVWGLSQEKGRLALDAEPKALVAGAQMRRRSYKGVIEVIYGGETPQDSRPDKGKGAGPKRKADSDPLAQSTLLPISKAEKKRMAKRAKLASSASADIT